MLEQIILGISQGIFEWLPVSSEGVVALISNAFVKELNPIDLALFLHLGTLLAVLVYFYKEWIEILTFKKPKLLKFLVITTIISLVVSYPLYKMVRSVMVGSTLLMLTGLGLLLTSYFHKKKRVKMLDEKKLIGVAGVLQGLAVIPGLSRSGSTIFGLSLGKEDPKEILKLSYLMSVPVVLASSIYLMISNPILVFNFWPALIFSFLSGILTLKILLKVVKKVNFSKFTFIFALLCFLGAIIDILL